jgi:hypothetical protein
MTRDEIENKSLNELLDIINNKYGKTRGNDLVAREAFRIYSKNIDSNISKAIKLEAAKRVLSGQFERQEINIENDNIH